MSSMREYYFDLAGQKGRVGPGQSEGLFEVDLDVLATLTEMEPPEGTGYAFDIAAFKAPGSYLRVELDLLQFWQVRRYGIGTWPPPYLGTYLWDPLVWGEPVLGGHMMNQSPLRYYQQRLCLAFDLTDVEVEPLSVDLVWWCSWYSYVAPSSMSASGVRIHHATWDEDPPGWSDPLGAQMGTDVAVPLDYQQRYWHHIDPEDVTIGQVNQFEMVSIDEATPPPWSNDDYVTAIAGAEGYAPRLVLTMPPEE